MGAARLALLLLAALASLPAIGAEGRIELNHLRALAGGVTPTDVAGYPITLGVPGSYVLTGDLAPPPGTGAILVPSTDVDVDLNGFTVRGGFTCAPGSCASGTGIGVAASSTTVANVRVSNGTVRGFPSTCVLLGTLASAQRLRVADCGADGIFAGAGSRVLANRIDSVGRHGINLSSRDAQHGDNAVGAVAVGITGGRSILGGSAVSGSACTDGGCSRRGAQRYFLTTTPVSGSAALGACGTGFHMASLYELLDTAHIEYDPTRGTTADDSGTGPPAQLAGWVKPGSSGDDCNDWSSNLITSTGMRAMLLGTSSMGSARTQISPWQVGDTATCNTTARVWCVED